MYWRVYTLIFKHDFGTFDWVLVFYSLFDTPRSPLFSGIELSKVIEVFTFCLVTSFPLLQKKSSNGIRNHLFKIERFLPYWRKNLYKAYSPRHFSLRIQTASNFQEPSIWWAIEFFCSCGSSPYWCLLLNPNSIFSLRSLHRGWNKK